MDNEVSKVVIKGDFPIFRGQVVVDGNDVSDKVSHVKVDLQAGKLPTITMQYVLPFEIDIIAGVTADDPAAQLAKAFHIWYERLAPSFGYETRKETAVPWEEIPDDSPNKRLMIAVCEKILQHGLEATD